MDWERIVVKTVDGISHEVDIPAHNEHYFKNRIFNDLESIQKTVELAEEQQKLYNRYLRNGLTCFLWTSVSRHFETIAFVESCSTLMEEENAES